MTKRHTVRPGDCIASIAYENGFFVDTLWDHPENAKLRERYPNPYLLVEGDVVFVPDLRLRAERAATGERHRFRRRGVPETLRLRFLDEDEAPRAGVPFALEIDGELVKRDATDRDGAITVPIPPNAKHGRIVLWPRAADASAGEEPEHDEEEYALELGQLEPITLLVGVQKRLASLGYGCGPTGELDEMTRESVRRFQVDHDLPATGDVDAATEDAVRRVFGG